MKLKEILGIGMLVLIPGSLGVMVSAHASTVNPPFAAVDTNGALVTRAAPVNGEVVTYRGVAHTVENASVNVYGVTTFHLTNPFAASGNITLVPVS